MLEVPLLCKEGLGEVDSSKKNTWSIPFNLSSFAELTHSLFRNGAWSFSFGKSALGVRFELNFPLGLGFNRLILFRI